MSLFKRCGNMKKLAYILLFIALAALCSCKKQELAEEFVSVEMLKKRAISGDVKSIGRLIERFDDEDREVQTDAYKAILTVKAPAVDIMLKELKDADGEKREYIIAALGIIKDPKAIKPLIAILKGSGARRYIAARALEGYNDENAMKTLVEALDDKDTGVKRYAAMAIVKSSEKSEFLLGELIGLMKSSSVKDKDYALSALGELKDKRAFDVVHNEVGGKFNAQAIWALGKLRDERAVDAVVGQLKNTDWHIRVAAARSLGSIHSEKAIPALKAIIGDENVFVREWAARALEDITGKDYKYKNEKEEIVMPTSLYR